MYVRARAYALPALRCGRIAHFQAFDLRVAKSYLPFVFVLCVRLRVHNIVTFVLRTSAHTIIWFTSVRLKKSKFQTILCPGAFTG